ncbi:MAG: leucine-rich repeat domain-containing protein [Ruminiclostridium sp.]|nr:leucine-rich repeat domain-containing protein [Ruminiclostridium sp.]
MSVKADIKTSIITSIKINARRSALALTILLCISMLFCPMHAAEYEGDSETKEPLTWDKWLYYDNGGSITLCGYTGTEDRIVTPAEINGKKVTRIAPQEIVIDFMDVTTYTFFEAYNKNTSEMVISEGVVSVDRYAFYSQSILKSVILPESLTFIGENAFEKCVELTSVTVPENVAVIGAYAFRDSGLTEIFLPEGLNVIGGSAFSGTPLTQIYIPDSVIYIGESAFSGSKIEELFLPGGLVKLEDNLLQRCISLKKVCIGEGVVWLGSDMFNVCPNLEEVYFPSTLRGTGRIFKYNRNLKRICFAADRDKCEEDLGNCIMDDLSGKNSILAIGEEIAEYYDDVEIVYNTPVPLSAPSPYPGKPKEADKLAVLLISLTLLFLTLTVIFVILFISGKKREAAIKAEEKKKKEEGFRPEVLGTWECVKCKTLNSPIGNYCYKCGRKR